MYINKTSLLEPVQTGANQSIETEKQESGTAIGKDSIVYTVDKTRERSSKVQEFTYGKPESEGEAVLAQIEEQAQQANSAVERKNEMLFAANTTSETDYNQMEEDGFSLQSTKIETVVTETDKIKIQLAKAGKDVSYFGDMPSDAQLAEVLGSDAMARQLATQLEQADLPVTTENMSEATEAAAMAQELTPPTDGAVKYMVDNQLEPTIGNLYRAEYAGSSSYQSQPADGAEYTKLQEQVEEVIAQAGLPISEETLATGNWMLANEIPLTAENLMYVTDLKQMELPMQANQVAGAIAASLAAGGKGQDAVLLEGYSMQTQAQHTADVVNEATDEQLIYLIEHGMELTVENLEQAGRETAGYAAGEAPQGTNGRQTADNTLAGDTGYALLQARRQLEEARLAMSAQANYALLKQGISIDTIPLVNLVEELKAQENSYYKNLLAQSGIDTSQKNIDTFRETVQTVEALKEVPAYILGIPEADEDTLASLYENGRSMQDTFEKAGTSYETMMTAPRKDMGDSIQKAFANVDDILSDLGLKESAANERAVRILAYNSQEITAESIQEVKAADEAVQRAFKNLTPATVREMIGRGINPLDMTVEELNQTAVQIQTETGNKEEERFSKYLWRMEQSHEITQEERDSFLGIYRLIQQVEKTDGAAVGALLQQGGELTMRNLLTQVRSERHEGREYTVDDSFGGVTSAGSDKMSITEQIEQAYQKNCLSDVAESLTPENMKAVMSDENWKNLTPEQLAEALSQADTSVSEEVEAQIQEKYAREQLSDFAACVNAPDEVYQMLEESQLPVTMYHVMAASELLTNRNEAFRRFFAENTGDTAEESIDFAAVKEEILERFADAVKTPEELAKAQEALADTAEQVMKTMIQENENVTTMDIRQMKLLNAQIALGTARSKEENYAIPVLVGDEVTNVSLKIVRGKEEKGLVDITFSTDRLGKIAAQLKATASGITGYVASDRQATSDWLSQNQEVIAEALSSDGEEVSGLQYVTSRQLDLNQFGKNDESQAAEGEDTAVQTATLYHMAEAFLTTVKQLAAQ